MNFFMANRNRIQIILPILCLAMFVQPGTAQAKHARPVASSGNAPVVRRAIENVTRSIEVYSATGRLSNARQYIVAAEGDLEALKRGRAIDESLIDHLQSARDSLVRAELFSRYLLAPRRTTSDELSLLTEMSWGYKCSIEGADGVSVGLDAHRCMVAIIAEARQHQKLALLSAIDAGLYTP